MYSTKELIKRIQFCIENNDIERANKYKEYLKQKEEYMKNKIQTPTFDEVMKMPNVVAKFIRGSKYVHIITDLGTYPYKLRLNGKGIPSEMNDEDKMQTKQYKIMSALGFKTKNYRTYYMISKENKLELWISLFNSRIKKIKKDDYLVDSCYVKYNTQETKLVIRKGLKMRDIELMKFHNPGYGSRL